MLMFFGGVAVAFFYIGRAVAAFQLPVATEMAFAVAIIGYLLAGYAALRSGAIMRFRIRIRRARDRQHGDS